MRHLPLNFFPQPNGWLGQDWWENVESFPCLSSRKKSWTFPYVEATLRLHTFNNHICGISQPENVVRTLSRSKPCWKIDLSSKPHFRNLYINFSPMHFVRLIPASKAVSWPFRSSHFILFSLERPF